MMSPPQPEKVSSGSLSSAARERASTRETKTTANDASNSKRLTTKADVSRHHLALASEELSSLSDLVKGIKKEISAYSQIEHEYMQHLESELTKGEVRELDDNMRLQLTANQIRRLRYFKKEALDELTAVNTKIAQLESRVERISNEEAEAELNVKLYELQMLYGGTVAMAGMNADDNNKSRYTTFGSRPPTLRGVSRPEEPRQPEEEVAAGSRKISRKAPAKAKRARSKDSGESGRYQDGPSPNDLTETESTAAERPEERNMIPQTDEVNSNDVSSLNDNVSDTSTPASFPSSMATDATVQSDDTGNELNNSDSVKNDDTAVNSDLSSLITLEQEQSQPLSMPELDIDESIEGRGKKKRWGFNFPRVKKQLAFAALTPSLLLGASIESTHTLSNVLGLL